MLEAWEIAKQLGVLPALAIVLCYVHHAKKIRPVLVRALALMDAVADHLGIDAKARAESEREAEGIVPEAPEPGGLLGILSVLANGKKQPPAGPPPVTS